MSTARHIAAWVLPLLVIASAASRAGAQASQMERARERYRQADLEGALQALQKAAASDELSREQLVELLERRALLQAALGDREAAHGDLGRLASFAPEHELAEELPPDLREQFEQAVASVEGPVAVRVEVGEEPGALSLRAEVARDPSALVRETRVRARVSGGPWHEGGARLVIPVQPPARVDYFAQALGPGGVVVASAGTVAAPLQHELAAAEGPAAKPASASATGALEGASPGAGEADGGSTDRRGLWWGLGLSAAVLVAGIVLVAVLVPGDGGSERTARPSAPMLRF